MSQTKTVLTYMTRHPHSVRAGETLQTAEALLQKFNCHHLPVLDGGRLVGVVSDRDIRMVKPAERANVTVDTVCVDEPLTVDVDTSLRTAARIMADKRIGSLLVTEDGKLAGIFTSTDACRALADVV